MRQETIFRFVVIAQALSVVVLIVANGYAEDSLPGLIRYYLQEKDKNPTSSYQSTLMWAGVIFLLCYVMAWVGLYLFKQWARPLYVVTVFAGFVLGLLNSEPTIYTNIENAAAEAFVLFDGIVLSMLFFSPISEHFKKAA